MGDDWKKIQMSKCQNPIKVEKLCLIWLNKRTIEVNNIFKFEI